MPSTSPCLGPRQIASENSALKSQDLKTVFESGDRKAIEVVMSTLDIVAIKATEWAKEQKERRGFGTSPSAGHTGTMLPVAHMAHIG
jgi:hypothetical protein